MAPPEPDDGAPPLPVAAAMVPPVPASPVGGGELEHPEAKEASAREQHAIAILAICNLPSEQDFDDMHSPLVIRT
jgi:hypothetical protein